MLNRTTVIIILIVYLLSLGFILSAINTDVSVNYSNENTTVGNSTYSIFGFELYHSDGISLGNLVTNISDLPIWFNSLFILLPVILLTVFVILMFIPTIPPG